jgi:hypothetical protein
MSFDLFCSKSRAFMALSPSEGVCTAHYMSVKGMGQQQLNLWPLILMSAAAGRRVVANGQTSMQAPLGTDGCPNRTKLVPSSSSTET